MSKKWTMNDVISKNLTVTGGAGKLINQPPIPQQKEYVFYVKPCPAPRMVRSNTWKPTPMVLRYRAFKDELRIAVNEQKFQLQETLDIIFIVPLPESWSMKKKMSMENKPVQVRPDIDNYLKAFMDTMVTEDGFVWKIQAQKIYGAVGKIIIKT